MHCKYRKRQKRKTGNVITGLKACNGAKRLLKFAPLPSEKHKKSHNQQCFTPTITGLPKKMCKILETNKRPLTGLTTEQK